MQEKIKIFQREVDDGVAEAVRSQASVAYLLESPTIVEPNVRDESLVQKIKAENKDQVDLYYLESVLVSTNWNANDDVFLPSSTWAARNTPEDKQFNFMHDENDIIGHITGSYVVDRQGNRVEATSDGSHPTDFDIVTRVVLYTSWAEEKNRERMDQIIAELKAGGKWFVSMECLFAGFDYAVIDNTGKQSVIARDEESAFLTKHLRSYGGTGAYEGFKLGRALNNISFSGEGLVDNPANKKSIILSNAGSTAFCVANTLNIGETEMADITTAQFDALKAELAEAKSENKDIKAKMDKVQAEETQAVIEAHQAEIVSKDEAIAELEASVTALELKVQETQKSLEATEAEFDNFKKKDEDRKKKDKKEKREAALVAAGLEADKAIDTVASLDSLDDDAFASIVELYASKQTPASSDEDGEAVAEDSDSDDSSVEADALDDTEATEVLLKGGDSDDEVDSTRAEVAEFLAEAMNIG